MKKIVCCLAIAIASLTVVSAQDYNWGVGVRLGGETGGASVKYKFNSVSTIEGILGAYWSNGFTVTALYERYVPVIGQGFHFYYGGGAHIGSWKKDFSLGIDGIIGLEYKIKSTPLAFSLDYKPALNLFEKTKFQWADIALGIRVTF